MIRPSNTSAGSCFLLFTALGLISVAPQLAHAQSFEEDLREVFGMSATYEIHEVIHESPPSGADDQGVSELRFLATAVIRVYQMTLSETDTHSCNFYPSCSHFGKASLERYGLMKGGLLAADRLMRCHGIPTMAKHYVFDPQIGRYIDPIEAYADTDSPRPTD